MRLQRTASGAPELAAHPFTSTPLVSHERANVGGANVRRGAANVRRSLRTLRILLLLMPPKFGHPLSGVWHILPSYSALLKELSQRSLIDNVLRARRTPQLRLLISRLVHNRRVGGVFLRLYCYKGLEGSLYLPGGEVEERSWIPPFSIATELSGGHTSPWVRPRRRRQHTTS